MNRRTLIFELPDGTRIDPDAGKIGLASLDVSPPKPKLMLVNIEGRNGALDMTEWAGDVFYENRVVRAQFRTRRTTDISALTDLNGRTVKLYDSDIGMTQYYEGRCQSVKRRDDKFSKELTMEFSCRPYRIHAESTVYASKLVSGTNTITLRALAMPAVPVLTLKDTGAQITCDGVTGEYAEGTHTPGNITLTRALKVITVVAAAAGEIRLVWKDGEM